MSRQKESTITSGKEKCTVNISLDGELFKKRNEDIAQRQAFIQERKEWIAQRKAESAAIRADDAGKYSAIYELLDIDQRALTALNEQMNAPLALKQELDVKAAELKKTLQTVKAEKHNLDKERKELAEEQEKLAKLYGKNTPYSQNKSLDQKNKELQEKIKKHNISCKTYEDESKDFQEKYAPLSAMLAPLEARAKSLHSHMADLQEDLNYLAQANNNPFKQNEELMNVATKDLEATERELTKDKRFYQLASEKAGVSGNVRFYRPQYEKTTSLLTRLHQLQQTAEQRYIPKEYAEYFMDTNAAPADLLKENIRMVSGKFSSKHPKLAINYKILDDIVSYDSKIRQKARDIHAMLSPHLPDNNSQLQHLKTATQAGIHLNYFPVTENTLRQGGVDQSKILRPILIQLDMLNTLIRNATWLPDVKHHSSSLPQNGHSNGNHANGTHRHSDSHRHSNGNGRSNGYGH